MVATAQQLLDLVGETVTAESTALAQGIVDKAILYVEQYQAGNEPDPSVPVVVPASIVDGAVLACAEDIWVRTKAQNGIVLTNYDSGEDGGGVVVRIGRDPLVPVRPLLAPWYPPLGFA